jgi:hypothetical protein
MSVLGEAVGVGGVADGLSSESFGLLGVAAAGENEGAGGERAGVGDEIVDRGHRRGLDRDSFGLAIESLSGEGLSQTASDGRAEALLADLCERLVAVPCDGFCRDRIARR